MKSFSPLKYPLVSERAVGLAELGKYTFVVEEWATKPEIMKAVARQYKVHPLRVAIVRVPSKTRHFRQKVGSKAGRKKAIVTLKKGEKLDILPT